MGRIEVDPGQLEQASGLLGEAALDAAPLAGIAHAAGGTADEPPATAQALAAFATAWASGGAILDTELQSLARSAEAAAFFYRRADQGSMGGS